ncbi:MAG: hypothetical protein PHS30_10610, partial [Bacteroidales bacterium]|nr:hypothetical protein [Bacteroidales bacterium]
NSYSEDGWTIGVIEKQFQQNEKKNRFFRLRLDGYYQAREFYVPKNENDLPNSDIPELCNTIYWNPMVITNEKGEASIKYDNGGNTTTVRVNVQGLATDGCPLTGETKYIVKKY